MRGLILSGAAGALGVLFALGCGKKTEPSSSSLEPGPTPGGPKAGSGSTEADKAEAAARLKRIGLALFNHESQNGRFPAGVLGLKGALGLSWRVAVLPHLGKEEAALYEQFNLKEPWDSETNKQLIEKMPAVYASPGITAAGGKTHVRSFAGPHAFIPPAAAVAATAAAAKQPGGFPAGGRRIIEFADGNSNTLIVAEAAEAVEWTKPDDLPFPDGKSPPVPKLGGVFPGGFHGLIGDGTVRFFPDTLSEDSLRALITVDGGETPGADVLAILRAPKPKEPNPPAPPAGGSTKPSRGTTQK